MNTFSTIALCLAAVIGAASIADAATDYCDKSLCCGGTHIACNHTGQFDTFCPPDATLVSITTELQEFLLKLLNEKRNLVAGGEPRIHKRRVACRMGTMQWDEELAKLAELKVKQCDMWDVCHNTKSFPRSGQNLASISIFTNITNEKKMLEDAVQMWYDEIDHTPMRFIDNFPEYYRGPIIKNFIDLVVESSNRVGCAAATYTENGQRYKTFLVACNMARRFKENRPVFNSCNNVTINCVFGKNPLYPNLCITSEKYWDYK